jgi:hypothetical protein
MHNYLAASRTAGYSGFVIYWPTINTLKSTMCLVWMIPGTFEHDWDNR